MAAEFYSYNNRKWWWFVMYLNLAAAKHHDPEGYDSLVDIIVLISTVGEEGMTINTLHTRGTHGTP